MRSNSNAGTKQEANKHTGSNKKKVKMLCDTREASENGTNNPFRQAIVPLPLFWMFGLKAL